MTPPERSWLRTNLWWAYLVWAIVGAAAYFFAPRLAGAGILFNVLGLSSSVALVAGARLHRPARLLPWYLFAAAQVSFVTGDVLYYTVPSFGHYHVDFPSTGDVFYVAVYPVIVAGLLLMLRAREPHRDRAALIDAFIIGIGLGVVSWVFLMVPYTRDTHLALTDKALSIAYPLLDVLVLAVTVRLAISTGRRPPAFLFLVAGLACLVTADTVYGLIELHGTYQPGSWLDSGWLAYYFAWGATSLHPSMTGLCEPAQGTGGRLSSRRLPLLAAVSLLAPVVLAFRLGRDRLVDDGVLVAGTVLLFLLVVERLRVVLVQHERSLERERILSEAGAAMAGAGTTEATCAAAIDAVGRLDRETRVSVAVIGKGPGDVTLYTSGTASAGGHGRAVRRCAMPEALLEGSLEAAAVPPRDLALALEVPPDQDLVLLALRAQETVTGFLALSGRGPLPPRVRDAVDALVSQLALALEAARFRQQQSEERFRSLVQSSSDVITVVQVDGTIRYQSPAVEHVLGFNDDELVGGTLFDLVHPEDVAKVRRALDRPSTRPRPSPRLVEARHRERSGGWRHVEMLCTDMTDDPNVEGILVNMRDISERKAFQERLTHYAFHDASTGLANHVLLRDRVQQALARQARSGMPLSVAFVDIDDFKSLNDRFGHTAGDRVLAEVGRRLTSAVRAEDTAARLGGDEFALLLESVGHRDAPRVADNVLAALAPPFIVDGHEVVVRASLGIAVSTADGGRPARCADELLRDAVRAMYVAKEDNKGRYEMFHEAMHARAVRRLEVQEDLERALARGELRVYYQPVVELDSGRVAGVEALVRWQHPQLRLVPPADFVPVAEESGLILDIGRWVLERTCSHLAALRRSGPATRGLTAAVNLSARQLQDDGLVKAVSAAVDSSGVDPCALTVEITETMMMRDPALSASRLRDLKRLGVRVAVDDFGTGYSSLNYLRQLPIDVLKMDKSFVDRIHTSRDDRVIAEAIIRLAEVLGLRTVAEGIETAEQMEQLIELGCQFGQGYHLARPMDEVALVGYLERRPAERAGRGGVAVRQGSD